MTLHSVLASSFALFLPLMLALYFAFELPPLLLLLRATPDNHHQLAKRLGAPFRGHSLWLLLTVAVAYLAFPNPTTRLIQPLAIPLLIYVTLLVLRTIGVYRWQRHERHSTSLRYCAGALLALQLAFLLWLGQHALTYGLPMHSDDVLPHSSTMPTLMVTLILLSVLLPLLLAYRLWAQRRFQRHQSALKPSTMVAYSSSSRSSA